MNCSTSPRQWSTSKVSVNTAWGRGAGGINLWVICKKFYSSLQRLAASTWTLLLSIASFALSIDLSQGTLAMTEWLFPAKEGRKAGRTPSVTARARRMDIAHQLRENKERKEGGGETTESDLQLFGRTAMSGCSGAGRAARSFLRAEVLWGSQNNRESACGEGLGARR